MKKRNLATIFVLGLLMLSNPIRWARAQEKTMTKILFVEIKDSVKTLKEKKESYQVLFNTHAGIYYLNKKNTNFESLLTILKESQTGKKEIKLQVDSNSLEINILIL
ncbi:MAG: hypothetical protein EXR74_04195 [Bdellovibrionales bacterium]|nr:hypothetical protein [Bdellovibrionales bacterium]